MGNVSAKNKAIRNNADELKDWHMVQFSSILQQDLTLASRRSFSTKFGIRIILRPNKTEFQRSTINICIDKKNDSRVQLALIYHSSWNGVLSVFPEKRGRLHECAQV